MSSYAVMQAKGGFLAKVGMGLAAKVKKKPGDDKTVILDDTFGSVLAAAETHLRRHLSEHGMEDLPPQLFQDDATKKKGNTDEPECEALPEVALDAPLLKIDSDGSVEQTPATTAYERGICVGTIVQFDQKDGSPARGTVAEIYLGAGKKPHVKVDVNGETGSRATARVLLSSVAAVDVEKELELAKAQRKEKIADEKKAKEALSRQPDTRPAGVPWLVVPAEADEEAILLCLRQTLYHLTRKCNPTQATLRMHAKESERTRLTGKSSVPAADQDFVFSLEKDAKSNAVNIFPFSYEFKEPAGSVVEPSNLAKRRRLEGVPVENGAVAEREVLVKVKVGLVEKYVQILPDDSLFWWLLNDPKHQSQAAATLDFGILEVTTPVVTQPSRDSKGLAEAKKKIDMCFEIPYLTNRQDSLRRN
jgi:uncharacterized protein YwbE